jgi:diguanylate cyclase (GGDEF)-like protein
MAGECVARYGCEKFMYVISAGSEVEAYAKVEAFRKAVRQLTFDCAPQLSVTVSGGLVPCSARGVNDVRHLLSKVDELRMVAKSQGKNQIRNMVEN